MEISSVNYTVETPTTEWWNHQLRKEWEQIQTGESFNSFLKQKYNIHLFKYYIDYSHDRQTVTAEFQSEQDYILWQLHQ